MPEFTHIYDLRAAVKIYNHTLLLWMNDDDDRSAFGFAVCTNNNVDPGQTECTLIIIVLLLLCI